MNVNHLAWTGWWTTFDSRHAKSHWHKRVQYQKEQLGQPFWISQAWYPNIVDTPAEMRICNCLNDSYNVIIMITRLPQRLKRILAKLVRENNRPIFPSFERFSTSVIAGREITQSSYGLEGKLA